MKPLLRPTGVVAAIALTLGLATAPAAAQDKKVRVQMGWAFPSTTGLLGPTQTRLVETLRTHLRRQHRHQVLRARRAGAGQPVLRRGGHGSLDVAWTTPGFWTGKDIAFAVYSTVPFGPGIGEYLAWMKDGGGEKMMQELYAKYNIHVRDLRHLIPPEASGWFRKEIKTLDDLKGLKMRFFGLGANVMQKLGVSTQLLQAGEIFQALQLGTIDATEFSMPVMDLSLGFHQVAKFYYFPGWHQQATFGDLIINKAKWDSLSPTQKAQVEAACDQTMLKGISRRRGGAVQGHEGDREQGRQADDVAARIPRRLREGLERGGRRAGGQEPGVQEGLGLAQQVPQGLRDLEGHAAT